LWWHGGNGRRGTSATGSSGLLVLGSTPESQPAA
jgi:hypothetical protein